MSNTFKTTAATMARGHNAVESNMIENIKDSRIKSKYNKIVSNDSGYRYGNQRNEVARVKVRDRRIQRKREQRQFEREMIQEHNDLMIELRELQQMDW